MTRDARLTLADDLDQLADRELGLAQKQQQAQPGRITRGAQHGNQGVHRNLLLQTHKHIFI